MLNYLGVFCQLKKVRKLQKWFFLLLLVACSSSDYSERKVVTPIPNWLDAPRNFRLKETAIDRKPPAHLFFDHLPFVDFQNKMLNVVVETPAESEYEYGFELVSGQFYTQHLYCAQQDVWKRYDGTLTVPSYTTAFVPRLLDSLGDPQRVIIFGSEKFYQKHYAKKLGDDYQKSVRVRIIGSKILQYCDQYPCQRDQWESHLLLVAVDPFDKDFKNIKSVEQLERVIDWPYAKAFLENAQGRYLLSKGKSFGRPAYRILPGARATKSLKYAFQKGHYFQFKEMSEMRKSCYDLFDYMWQSVLNLRKKRKFKKQVVKKVYADDSNVLTPDKLSGNVVSDVKKQDVVDKYQKELEKQILHLQFDYFFKRFVKQFGEEFFVCSKYVRMASINSDPERQVFMDFIRAFFLLDNLGHDFNCFNGLWAPRRKYFLRHHPVKNLNERLENCSTKKLNAVFHNMINYINALAKGNHRYLRYIDYDNKVYGTHLKIYSWILESGKSLRCIDPEDNKNYTLMPFPDKFKWKDFVDIHERLFNKDSYIR